MAKPLIARFGMALAATLLLVPAMVQLAGCSHDQDPKVELLDPSKPGPRPKKPSGAGGGPAAAPQPGAAQGPAGQ